jgi:hypothetical protein
MQQGRANFSWSMGCQEKTSVSEREGKYGIKSEAGTNGTKGIFRTTTERPDDIPV